MGLQFLTLYSNQKPNHLGVLGAPVAVCCAVQNLLAAGLVAQNAYFPEHVVSRTISRTTEDEAILRAILLRSKLSPGALTD